jgi:hypothetical protein
LAIICHIGHQRAAASLAEISHKFHHEIVPTVVILHMMFGNGSKATPRLVRAKSPLRTKRRLCPRAPAPSAPAPGRSAPHALVQVLARGYSRPRCMMSVLRNLQNFQEVAICGAEFLSENMPRNKRSQFTNVPPTLACLTPDVLRSQIA